MKLIDKVWNEEGKEDFDFKDELIENMCPIHYGYNACTSKCTPINCEKEWNREVEVIKEICTQYQYCKG